MKNFIYPFFVYLNLLAIFLLTLFFIFLLFKQSRRWVFSFIKKFGLWLIFLVSFLAMLGSLSFSEILQWPPCKLCWYQRIVMYPQVLISLIALKIKDKKAYFYHLYLSIIGFFIALFHYLIQKDIIRGIDCNLIASSQTCSLKINFAFGFISIPFMAMIGFLMIIIISILAKNFALKKFA